MLNKVNNIVPKRKFAHHEQFLLLPQHFQKSSAAEAPESVGNVINMCNTYLSVVVMTLMPLSCNLMIFNAFLLAEGSELTTAINIEIYSVSNAKKQPV